MSINLIITDDHQMVVQGLIALLQGEDDLKIVGTANNGQELQSLLETTRADVILLDISMPGMDGKEAATWLKANHPEIAILMLTMHAEIRYIKSLLRIGVEGYLLKGSGKEELIEAIQTVAEGHSYHDQQVTNILVEDIRSGNKPANADLFELTNREKEIVQLISKGFTSHEIADQLFIAAETVSTHRRNILSKGRACLEIRNMAGLISYLKDKGLIN